MSKTYRLHKNRGGHNKIDLTDKKFGNLLVLEDSGKRKSRRPIWKCRCDCGNDVEILGKYLLNGDTKSCGCLTKGNAHNRTGYKLLGGSYWYHVKSNAKRRGIPFTISAEYCYNLLLKQSNKCILSGLDIALVENYRDDGINQTASLDRKDNTKGYEEGNVQWVHKKINIMKNTQTDQEFLQLCVTVVKFNNLVCPRMDA